MYVIQEMTSGQTMSGSECKELLVICMGTVDVYDEYLPHGGVLLTRRMLSAKLTVHFGPDLLSGSGVASLLVFCSRTSSIL